MSSKASSLERAWAEAARQSGEDVREVGIFGQEASAEQLDLLADENGKLPANVFSLVRRQGPGRRPGSINKASKDVSKYILHKYGCPVEYMASIRAMPLDQMVQAMMEAEGFSEREEKLFALIEQANAMMLKAIEENWSEAKLKLIDRMLERIERAAAGMKAKPGDLAAKAVALQLNAANNESRYVRSAKPIEATVNHKLDGRIVGFVAPGQGDIGPVADVMKRAQEAVDSGMVDAAQLADLRVVNGEYRVVDDDGGEGVGI